MTTTVERRAYRPAEVAAMLGCSREYVFRQIEKGDLRSFKIGAARFISAAELDRFIADREQA